MKLIQSKILKGGRIAVILIIHLDEEMEMDDQEDEKKDQQGYIYP